MQLPPLSAGNCIHPGYGAVMTFRRCLAPVFCLALIGCGGSGEPEPTAATPTPTLAPTETPTATPAPVEAAPAPKRTTRSQAIRIARKRAGGGSVRTVERDEEDGRQVWKIELRRGGVEHKVEVSVRDGRVVDYERERDDDG